MVCLDKDRLTLELAEAIKELIDTRAIYGDSEPLALEIIAAEQIYEEKLAMLLDHIRSHVCGPTKQ
jgi:hypothetical protein